MCGRRAAGGGAAHRAYGGQVEQRADDGHVAEEAKRDREEVAEQVEEAEALDGLRMTSKEHVVGASERSPIRD